MKRADLLGEANGLARHYSRFRVEERLLLTGHSHQAWPDCGFLGQEEAFHDAAENLDRKWPKAFAKAEGVRRGFARLLDDPSGEYALGGSTHELLVRFLSALPLPRRPKIVTTDGEFHSLSRQLLRLEEAGLEILRLPAEPVEDLPERLADALDDRTAACMVSAVFYGSGRIVKDFGPLPAACEKTGARLLLDVYHALNVVPFSLGEKGLLSAYVVGGGYKYCQLGEGNCFLRFPEGSEDRPVVTGWFADFDGLEGEGGRKVGYGRGGARYAGSTYDPVSHYRAAKVFDFFREEGLDTGLLREVSQAQIAFLQTRFDALDLDPELLRRDRSVPLESIGGFLTLDSPRAGELARRLFEKGVLVDARGVHLRLGPAPYLSMRQLSEAMDHVGEAVREL